MGWSGPPALAAIHEGGGRPTLQCDHSSVLQALVSRWQSAEGGTGRVHEKVASHLKRDREIPAEMALADRSSHHPGSRRC